MVVLFDDFFPQTRAATRLSPQPAGLETRTQSERVPTMLSKRRDPPGPGPGRALEGHSFRYLILYLNFVTFPAVGLVLPCSYCYSNCGFELY